MEATVPDVTFKGRCCTADRSYSICFDLHTEHFHASMLFTPGKHTVLAAHQQQKLHEML